MIIGIGIDIIEVSRVKSRLRRRNALTRIFTRAEIKYCQDKARPAESFAARFAAKEAFLKAIGTGWGTAQSPKWTEIEVGGSELDNSQPIIRLSGKAKTITRKLGVKRIHISLTHTKQSAAAVVILEDR